MTHQGQPVQIRKYRRGVTNPGTGVPGEDVYMAYMGGELKTVEGLENSSSLRKDRNRQSRGVVMSRRRRHGERGARV